MRNNFIRKACGIACESMGTPTSSTGGPGFAIPQVVADYAALGMPGPGWIWNMQTSSWDIPEIIGGTKDLEDQGGNSVGLTFENATGLPNGELCISRTTVNTSRANLADSAVLDVSTADRIAIGVMFKQTSIAGTNLLVGKRTSQGYDFRLPSGYPQVFIRPLSGGDVTVTFLTVHGADIWHYVIYVIDRDPGVELAKAISELGMQTGSLAGKGSFTSTLGAGFQATANATTMVAAMAAWEGSDVALLTQQMCIDFLAKAGV